MAEPEYLPNADIVHAEAVALRIVLGLVVDLVSEKIPELKPELVRLIEGEIAEWQERDDLVSMGTTLTQTRLVDQALRVLQTRFRDPV